ncbi:hypothetical protein LTR17_000257 [Elasticomyces elasticus]|nr:hypothetical protein LTR17_000257 [Elasticomyces elasticus]
MGREVRGRHAKGCAPLEKLPVELLKMIMEYSLDFTTPPVPEVEGGVLRKPDCFGLMYTRGEEETCMFFTSLETYLKRKTPQEFLIEFIHPQAFCAPRLISKALLAPATEAMLGVSSITGDKAKAPPGPKYLSRPGTELGDRNRFWDNDFVFPRSSEGVEAYLARNINRPTHIERFSIINDCMPPTRSPYIGLRSPQGFLGIFRRLALAKKAPVMAFMVVCKHGDDPSEQRLHRYLGSVASTITMRGRNERINHEVTIHRQPWLGIGSCNAQLRQSRYAKSHTAKPGDGEKVADDDLLTSDFQDGNSIDDGLHWAKLRKRWAYFQYDARWATDFAEDLKLLEDHKVVGGVWTHTWNTESIWNVNVPRRSVSSYFSSD